MRVSNTGEPIAPDLASRMFAAWVSSRDADDGPFPTTFQAKGARIERE